MAGRRKNAKGARSAGTKDSGRGGRVLNPAWNGKPPVATTPKIKALKPVHSTSNGVTTIRGREVVRTVLTTSQTSYTAGIQATVPVNPGSLNLFPLLGEIAAGFEQYRFSKLAFIYEGCCPTTVQGQVVLTWDPDSKDGTPVSIQEALNMAHSGVSPPYGQIRLDVPSMTAWHYSDFETAADDRLINHGIVCISGFNSTSSSSTGYWWVDYTCELTSPQLRRTSSALLSASYNSMFQAVRTGPNYVFGAASGSLAFTTAGYFQVTAVVYNSVIAFPSVAVGAGLTSNLVSRTTNIAGDPPRSTWVYVVNVIDPDPAVGTLTWASQGGLNGQVFRLFVQRISKGQYDGV